MQNLINDKNAIERASSLAIDWQSWIKLERETITPKTFIIHGISFYLTQELLTTIEQAKLHNISINLSPEFLTNIRYYALFESQAYLQSGLNFCTYYQQDNSSEIMLRSVISLDGDILNQIRSDCLENREFALQITTIHYWLIAQVLQQLRTKLKHNWLTWLSWGLAALVVILTAIPNWQRLQSQPLLILFIPVMCWLLQWGFYRLLRLVLPAIKRWFLQQIMWGVFSHPEPKRKRAFDFFSRFLG